MASGANQLIASSQVWDDAGLDSLTLVAHIPTNSPSAIMVQYGETRTPLVKVDDPRVSGTGYSIYAATAAYLGDNARNPPAVTYDLIGSKDGKPVTHTFNKWELPFCQNS